MVAADAGLNDTGLNDTGLNDTGLNDTGLNDTGLNDTGLNERMGLDASPRRQYNTCDGIHKQQHPRR